MLRFGSSLSSGGIYLLRSDGGGSGAVFDTKGEGVEGCGGEADWDGGDGGSGRAKSARARVRRASLGKRSRRCSTRGSKDDERLRIP